MTLRRRSFLRSVAAGSAVCLAGCDVAPVGPATDAGPACPVPPVTPPPRLDYPSAAYFEAVARDLDAAGIGTPAILLDMDRVDANIDEIVGAIAPPLRYRIVEKSLPSLDLLAYVAARSGSERFMVLHLPFLAPLCDAFPSAEVLLGKAQITGAVRAFFEELPAGTDRVALARRVVLLADGPARLAELIALADGLGVGLRVAIEIDVGLRRSGLREPAELGPMLDAIDAAGSVELAGLLGYDGHVAFSPTGTLAGVRDAFEEAMASYQRFVDVLESPAHRHLLRPDLIFDSGGSATYPLYAEGTPVNDVAAGGGVLRPGGYPDHVIGALSPAIFIATPVLDRFESPRLPFFSEEQSARLFAGRQGLTIYGGGWPAFFTHPPGIEPAPFVSDPRDHVMVPNQGLVSAPAEPRIAPGDWVFYHPRQSDALFQFETIHLVRGGRLEETTMRPYPRRY